MMKKLIIFLFLLLNTTQVLGLQFSSSKSNSIYQIDVISHFESVEDDDNPEFMHTTGDVEITIHNKMITGLRFGRIKVRYYCKNDPNNDSLLADGTIAEYDYSFYDENEPGENYVAKGDKVTKIAKVYDDNGPCSGHYGGVEKSEVVSVQFAQYKNAAHHQRITCGTGKDQEEVEFAWAFVGRFKIVKIHTSHGIITKRVDLLVKEYEEKKKLSKRHSVETQTGRLAPGEDLVVGVDDKVFSLKRISAGEKSRPHRPLGPLKPK